ncbi:MAG: helix-turn-helix transcriptional regulator [Oligoflexia bacterium]|nr:helix-turn-helix transcriptional regulator [Oligoflexia bacterium]
MKYYELLKKREERDGSLSIWAVIKSVLMLWIEFLGLRLEDEVGTEFSAEYQSSLDKFLSSQNSEATKNNYKSRINSWVKLYETYQPEPSIDSYSFGEFLKRKVAEKNISKNSLFKKTKINKETLRRWMNSSRLPEEKKSEEQLKKLSIALGYPESYLTDNFVVKLRSSTRRKVFIEKTDHEKKLSRLCVQKYRLTEEEFNKDPMFSDLKKEFEHFYNYKIATILPSGVKRKFRWRITDGNCPTAKMYKEKMFSFFGFLKNKKGESIFHLSDLLNPELLTNFYAFYEERHEGIVTRSISDFHRSCCGPLVNYYKSYPDLLTQNTHPIVKKVEEQYTKNKVGISFAEYFKDNISTGVDSVYEIIKNFSIQLNEVVQISRFTEKKYEDWLDSPRPLRPLMSAVSDMKKDYFTKQLFGKTNERSNSHSLTLLRDIVLIEILVEKPIRDKSISCLRFGQELKKINGAWKLTLQPHQVKNKRLIEFEFSEETSKWITYYFERHKELNANSEYLLKTSGAEKDTQLYSIISHRMKQYTGRALGPHMFRALRVTDYLMNNDDGFIYAAEILDDDFSTVFKHYFKRGKNRRMSQRDRADIEDLRNEFREEGAKKTIYRLLRGKQDIRLNQLQEKLITMIAEDFNKEELIRVLNEAA